MTDAPELKACPFCGGSEVSLAPGVASFAPTVMCPCGCDLSGDSDEGVVTAWNTRADTITALEEENKRLREAFTWFLRHTSGKEMRKMGIVLNDSSDLEEAIQAIETRAALEGE